MVCYDYIILYYHFDCLLSNLDNLVQLTSHDPQKTYLHIRFTPPKRATHTLCSYLNRSPMAAMVAIASTARLQALHLRQPAIIAILPEICHAPPSVQPEKTVAK